MCTLLRKVANQTEAERHMRSSAGSLRCRIVRPTDCLCCTGRRGEQREQSTSKSIINKPWYRQWHLAAVDRAAAIVLPVNACKSRLRTRFVSEFPETSWLCSFDGTAPLSRSPGAGTNPDWAENQHAPHPARRSAHQHAPIRKQEAQQGSFIMQLTCP